MTCVLLQSPGATPRQGGEEYIRRLERERAELLHKIQRHEEERLVFAVALLFFFFVSSSLFGGSSFHPDENLW